MPRATEVRGVRCDFCGKSQKEVRKLIAHSKHDGRPHQDKWIGLRPGAPVIYVCNECVERLWETLHDADLPG
ncbi:MAG TPA: ClpX C4-type zinc finger protein [Acidimicrobiales bacterium]|nr:ClpX C4-type zinc finger protein [Acidimicrobiales bacterium]